MELVYDSRNINMTSVTLSSLCLDGAKNVLQHPIILSWKRLLLGENAWGRVFHSLLYNGADMLLSDVWVMFIAGVPPSPQPPKPTPNHPWRQTTAPGSYTNHSFSKNLLPSPARVSIPNPHPILNLHHNKDKEGGGARGLRLRGVKTGGAMGPGRVMISPLAREKAPWADNPELI